jgi:hypothetical protein
MCTKARINFGYLTSDLALSFTDGITWTFFKNNHQANNLVNLSLVLCRSTNYSPHFSDYIRGNVQQGMGNDDKSKTERGNSKISALTCFGFLRLFSRDEADKLDYMREAGLEEFFLEEDESALTLHARKHAFSFVFKVLEKERTN